MEKKPGKSNKIVEYFGTDVCNNKNLQMDSKNTLLLVTEQNAGLTDNAGHI
jgi:hypothetical protein